MFECLNVQMFKCLNRRMFECLTVPGGTSERTRAEELISRIHVVPDQESEKIKVIFFLLF